MLGQMEQALDKSLSYASTSLIFTHKKHGYSYYHFTNEETEVQSWYLLSVRARTSPYAT